MSLKLFCQDELRFGEILNRVRHPELELGFPEKYKVVSAKIGSEKLTVKEGAVDLSSLNGKQIVRFRVAK